MRRMQKKNFVLTKVLNILLSIVQILIALYIVLRLFGAAQVPFVHWIYALNKPLLAPFAGIFEDITLQDNYILDLSAVFALIAYSIIGFLLIRLAVLIEGR